MTITAPDPTSDLPVRLDWFHSVFRDHMLANDVGGRLGCSEVEALAELLDGLGDVPAADAWRSGHLDDCDDVTVHVPSEAADLEGPPNLDDFCAGYVVGRYDVPPGVVPDEGTAAALAFERGREAGLEFAAERDSEVSA